MPTTVRDAQHITIYHDPRHFAGWPFNHGFKAFSERELLISFSRGPCDYSSIEAINHSTVDAKGGEYVTMRSLDGGITWDQDSLHSLGTRQEINHALLSQDAAAPGEARDWSSLDFFLTAGFGIPPQAHQDLGYIQLSGDRGRTWDAPRRMPTFGLKWVQVKPDYVVRDDGVVLLFVTAGIGDSSHGQRVVAVYASPDSGISWHYLSAIIAASPDRPFVKRYYASPVLLDDGRILVALRCQMDARNAWPEVFESEDGGRSWRFVSRVSDWGGPTDLTLLHDGRLLAVYGYRVAPYGIRARISEDAGRSWGAEFILRDDGASWDLGYPRTVKLGGGRVMSAYYFNTTDPEIDCSGGPRHIAGTIFKP